MEFIKNMLEGPSQPQAEKFALGGYADGLPVPNFLQIPEIFFDPTKKGFNKLKLESTGYGIETEIIVKISMKMYDKLF